MVQPLRDRVLVLRSTAEQTTAGGLIIPGNVQEKPAEGTVVEVGGGMVAMDGTLVPLIVKVGDKVLFQKGAGTEVRVGGVEHLLLRENEILCTL